jgi:hypothetical protein
MRERDLAILNFNWRYRVGLVQVYHRRFFEGLTPKAAERVITRLMKEGLLQSFPLHGANRYYTLTPKGARVLGVSEKWLDKPMGPQALIQNVSILAACCLGPTARERMTAEEFTGRFPGLVVRGLGSSRYYLHQEGPDRAVRLGLFLPDFQSDARRIVRKVRREFDRRMKHPEWNRLIRNDLFVVMVLTAFPSKVDRLGQLLGREHWPYRIEAVPSIANLLVREEHP